MNNTGPNSTDDFRKAYFTSTHVFTPLQFAVLNCSLGFPNRRDLYSLKISDPLEPGNFIPIEESQFVTEGMTQQKFLALESPRAFIRANRIGE